MATFSEVTNITFTTEDPFGNTSDQPILEEAANNLEAILIPIVFGTIFLIGVIGNAALIFTVLNHKNMRNTPNIFVVSLSVGDLLLLLFSVPFSSTLYTFTSWPYGEFVCKLNFYMQTLSLGISVFTLTALSGDRYIAIVHPMSKHTGKPTLITVITVVGIWTLAIMLAIPEAYTSTVEHFPTYNVSGTQMYISVCLIYPHDLPQWYLKAHTLFKFAVFFLIPVFIIGMFYVLMAKILIVSSREMPCESMKDSVMNQQQKRQIKARLKVAKIVMSFIALFVICWLPRHIYVLASHHFNPEYNMGWHVLQMTSFCLMFIYSCVNPYALWFLSSQFRKYYNRYLFCCCPKFKYRSLAGEQSHMYHFNSTVRRNSTTYTGVAHSQSMC